MDTERDGKQRTIAHSTTIGYTICTCIDINMGTRARVPRENERDRARYSAAVFVLKIICECVHNISLAHSEFIIYTKRKRRAIGRNANSEIRTHVCFTRNSISITSTRTHTLTCIPIEHLEMDVITYPGHPIVRSQPNNFVPCRI